MNAFVTPGKLGANQVDVYLTNPDRRPYVPAEVRASAYLPARDLGPFDVTLTPAGPGRYTNPRALFTVTGEWQLRITVRSDAFDETTVTVPVTVY
jgi:copper transport protein